jgi:hypothetical protein
MNRAMVAEIRENSSLSGNYDVLLPLPAGALIVDVRVESVKEWADTGNTFLYVWTAVPYASVARFLVNGLALNTPNFPDRTEVLQDLPTVSNQPTTGARLVFSDDQAVHVKVIPGNNDGNVGITRVIVSYYLPYIEDLFLAERL